MTQPRKKAAKEKKKKQTQEQSAPPPELSAADKALRAHQSRILALLEGDSAERAEAFDLLRTAAKAPRGLLVLEEQYEVPAAGVMVACVHPLLDILSRPFERLPPSVSGSRSLPVDEKSSNAIAGFKHAVHKDLEEKSLAAFVDRLQSAPVRHDDVPSTWKPEQAMRADEWRALAASIASVLPCRLCVDPARNAGGHCRADCCECARLMRKQKVELQHQRARSHADECEEATRVLQLIASAGTSIDSNTLADSFGAWASPVASLKSGVDCPPAQVETMKAATRPKTPVQEADAGTPGIEKEHKKTDVGGGKNKKKNGKKGGGAKTGKTTGAGSQKSASSPSRSRGAGK